MFLHKNVGFFSQLPILYFQQVTVIPTISFYQNDPYLNYVVLNINGDTALSGNNNTFLDSGFRNISATGNVTQGTFSPFSPAGWSGYFNGSSYLNLTAGGITDFGANPYTFECYLWLGSTGTNQTIYDGRNTGADAPNTNFTLSINTSAKIELVTNQANLITTTQGLISGSWNHIAVCRTTTGNNGASVYINGVGQTFTNATTYTNPRSTIGASSTTLGSAPLINSYISNLRVVKGTALYTTTFTPNSAEPLKLLANTSLLTLQDNRFVDNSRNNFTLSATGTPQTQPFSPIAPAVDYTPSLHGGSAYFDGSNILSIPANPAFNFDTGDFTIEFWINTNDYSLDTYGRTIFSFASDTTSSIRIFLPSAQAGILSIGDRGSSNLSITGTIVVANNIWHHVAISRYSNNMKLFVDGVQSGTTANNSTNFNAGATAQAYIGGNTSANGRLIGYISNLRVIKGQAVYTSNFTPPSRPVTATSNGGASVGTTAVPNLSVTPSLLLDFDNGGIIDRSYKNDVLVIGDSKTQTLSSKFGTGSLFFDGTGDYLAIPSSDTLNLATGDFTVEAWINTSTIATGAGNVIGRYSTTIATNNDLQFAIYRDGANLIVRPYSGTTNYIITVGTIAVNTWYHVALVRSGNTISGYLNGVLGGTPITTITGSLNNNINWNGVIISGGPNASVWNGYIEDIRITKGIARYTANFTPPSKLQANNSDPYYSNVVLFLDGNNIGSNVNNEFRATAGDAARLAITRTGATQGSFSPYSPNGWSTLFDNVGYFQINSNAAFAFPNGTNFTIECWVNFSSFINNRFYSVGSASTNQGTILTFVDGVPSFGVYATSNTVTSTVTLSANNWYHIAVTRSGIVTRIFVNGVQTDINNNDTNSYAQNNLRIGADFGTFRSAGYASNLRVIKGLAVYTSNFTPPTGTLPALSGSGFSTSLLTLQDNRFKDNSPNNFALSVGAGTPTVQAFNPYKQSTAYSPTVHGGSGYFNGSSYLTVPANAAFSFGTATYTVEAWVYLTARNTTWGSQIIGGHNYGSNPNFLLYVNTAGSLIFQAEATSITSTQTIPLNTWTHVAFTNSGLSTNTTYSLYINGVRENTTVASPPTISSTINIAIGSSTNNDAGARLTGYISNLRIVKGRALYTSNFTPPTSPVTAVNGTSLLLNFDNGYAIDSTGNNVITTVGDSRTDVLSTAPLSSSTGSLYFDGSSYISVLSSSSSNYDFGTTGQFTIECWINRIGNGTGGAGLGAYDAIVSHADAAGTTGPWGLYVKRADNKIGFYNGSTIKDTSASITNGVWTHIAVVRNSTNLITFINGVSAYNAANTDATNSLNRNLIIGWDNSTGGNQNYKFNGYIDDLRITKGVARYTRNFTPQTYENPTSNLLTYPTDPYRNLVVLDLNADTVNNEQNNTFLDKSGNNLTITRSGSTTQGSFSPFSPAGWSGYFNGSTDYLPLPANTAFAFGIGDFTIEFWINPSTTSSVDQIFVTQGTNTDGCAYISLTDGLLEFGQLISGVRTEVGTNILSINRWYHVAATRNSGTTKIFVDGILTDTTTNLNGNYTALQPIIASNPASFAQSFNGYLSNFRIVKGQALYTNTFTPPTAALTTTSTVSGVTLSAENVALLTLQDNRFKDNSNNNLTITPNGTPSVKPFSPFQPTATYSPTVHGGSGYFNGVGDFLSTSLTTLFNPSSSDFTVDAWIYPMTQNQTGYIYSANDTDAGNNLEFRLFLISGILRGWYFANTAYVSQLEGGTPIANSWNHVAWIRNGSFINLYLNGNKTASGNITGGQTAATTAFVNVGRFATNTTRNYFNGHISNLRIVKGVAITPPVGGPTAPVQAVSGTSLLLNFDNAGVVDSTGKNDVTTYSTAKVDYVNTRYGSGALKFNGTNDYMQVGTASDWTFLHSPSAKWTIEFWIYNNSSALGSLLDTNGSTGGAHGISLQKLANNTLDLFISNNTAGNVVIRATTTATIPLSTWTHVAITYDHSLTSNNMVVYFNGLSSLAATKTAQTPSTTVPANTLSIGAYGNGAGQFFNGAIDELRITNAVRYTNNFTISSYTQAQEQPLSAINSLTIDYFVVAGGGGGGGWSSPSICFGGGGGAGGYRIITSTTLSGDIVLPVIIGAGGAGGLNLIGTNGNDSSFNGTNSTGGGYGAGGTTVILGGAGGSGGGGHSNGSSNSAGGAGNTPSTTPSQGNNGGNGISIGGSGTTNRAGGGGGGAGGVGTTPTVAGAGGAGGIGVINPFPTSTWGVLNTGNYYIAGGGGGVGGASAGSDGLGGGSTANYGGGGKAGTGGGIVASNGGSGVVIIRYAGIPRGVGGIITTSGGYTTHVFTSSQMFKLNLRP